MVDEVITKQELIDAQKDAQSLDDFINGGDEQIVVTRLLKEYPTLANAIRQIYEKGGKFYPTLADANADIANIRTDVYVITGDSGAYYKATAGATTLTKSAYDPLTQSKNYADTALSVNTKRSGTIVLSNADVTLTDAQGNLEIVFLTGVLTQNVTVNFPKKTATWIVRNLTTGGFNVSLKVTDQTSSVSTVAGDIVQVYSNSSSLSEVDIQKAKLNSPAFTGAPTAPTADQGDRGLQLANTTFAFRVAHGAVTVNLTDGANTLTDAQVGVKTLLFAGTLTADAEVILPKIVGEWVVFNATGGTYNLIIKVLDQASGFITLPKGESKLIFSNAALVRELTKPASSGGGGSLGVNKGLFKYGQTYNSSDIVEHGSGIYTVKNTVVASQDPSQDAVNFQKISHNLQAGINKQLTANNVTLEPTSSNQSPMYMSNDGLKVWSLNASILWESADYGTTWYRAGTFVGNPVGLVRQLDNGELIVAVLNSSIGLYEVYRSEGYAEGLLDLDINWVLCYTVTSPKTNHTSAWSVSTYKNIVLLAEYGPKAGEMWGGVVAEEGENARYVRMSLDYGKTWSIVFDLNEHATTDGVHLHGVCYDPYWQRIWVTYGDKTNATMYSDDLGETWKFAHHGLVDGAPYQNVGIFAMPECILFGTDVAPNGVHRIDRAHGKFTADGTYPIDIAYALNSETVTRTHLCHGMYQAKWIPNAPLLIGFGSESNPAPSVILSTYDGWNFTEVWRDNINQDAGTGLRHVFGPTPTSKVIAVSNDQRTEGMWTKVTIEV